MSPLTARTDPCAAARDSRGYVELAVEWAQRLEELSAIRMQMRQQVRSSPLGDAPRYARDLLEVLTRAWESKTDA